MRSMTAIAGALIAIAVIGVGPAPAATGLRAVPIVVGSDEGGGPWLNALGRQGNWLTGFGAYFDFRNDGVNVAAGDVDGDGRDEIVTAGGWGGRAELRVFDGTGARETPTILANPFGAGAEVAAGDVDGDGRAELVTSDARGGPNVQVFDAVSGRRTAFFGLWQCGPCSNTTVRTAVADVDGDGRAEIVTAANGPGEPTVSIFSGLPASFFPQPLRTIIPFPQGMLGHLTVAAGDVSGDGLAEIVVGGVTPAGPEVRVYNPLTGLASLLLRPFASAEPDGLRVATGDMDDDGRADIVVSGGQIGAPDETGIRVFDSEGLQIAAFPGGGSGARVAAGDFDGDGDAELAFGSSNSTDAFVIVLDGAEMPRMFRPYPPSFTHGVRVATGDVDGDGDLEYATAQGPGGVSQADLFDAEGRVLRTFEPPADSTSDGAFVALGDVDGDLDADVVLGADSGGEPRVRVLDGDGREIASFLAFSPSFRGGVRVGTGDLDGDGRAEIIAGTGPGAAPAVRVFDLRGTHQLTFNPFSPFGGGVFVAGGDVTGDGRAEIVVGTGAGGDGLVRVTDLAGNSLSLLRAYERGFTGGVRVAVADVDHDGLGEIVTAPGPGRAGDVRFLSAQGRLTGSFEAFSGFTGGVYVAVPAAMGGALELVARRPAFRAGSRRRVTVAAFGDEHGGQRPEDFAATIRWGDGSRSGGTVVALASGSYTVTASKRYARPGRYTLRVGISDRLGRGVVRTTTVTVRARRR